MTVIKLKGKARVIRQDSKVAEIHGLKVGDIVAGTFNPNTDLFTFKWNDEFAVLTLYENAELVEYESLEYAVQDKENENHKNTNGFIFMEDLQKAKEYQELLGGTIMYGAGYCNKEGSYIELPFWCKTMKEARQKLYKELDKYE